jgi:hypothetical protein
VGAEKEGFWNYMHMALMTEDLVDCLQVIYPNHDFLLFFNQSSSHCQKRVDGLNVVGMNADWGGARKIMRDTEIIEGCLGPYPSTLTIDDVQRLVFVDSDDGPHYRKKGGCTKEDVVVGKKRKKKNKTDVLGELVQKKEFNPTKLYTKQQLETLAVEFSINLEHEVDDVKEGWLGKPKGLYQILW